MVIVTQKFNHMPVGSLVADNRRVVCEVASLPYTHHRFGTSWEVVNYDNNKIETDFPEAFTPFKG